MPRGWGPPLSEPRVPVWGCRPCRPPSPGRARLRLDSGGTASPTRCSPARPDAPTALPFGSGKPRPEWAGAARHPPSTDGGAHGGPWGGLVHSNGPCSLGAWSADLRMMPAGGSHAPAPATPQLTPALGPRKLPEGLHWHPIQSLRVGGEATRTLDKDPGQQGTRPQSRGRGRQTETLPCPVPAGEAAEQELGGQSPCSGRGGDGCQPRESETHREAGGAPSTSCFGDSCCRTEGQAGRGESELRIPPACTPLSACPGPWMDKGLAGPPAARPAGSV